MPIILTTGFQITGNEPIDSRITVANRTARLSFSEVNVFEGLLVYQQDTNEIYVLVDTTNRNTDSGWVLVNSGIVTSSLLTTSSFNSFTSSVVTTSSFNSFTSSVVTTSSFNTWTGSVVSQFLGTSSFATTASYINPTFISASAAASGFGSGGGGGTGNGFPYDGRTVPGVVSGSLIVSGSGIILTGSINTTGSDAFINSLRIGLGNGNNTTNLGIGSGILANNTSGFNNAAIGFQALNSNTFGQNNVAIGYSALKNNTSGSSNIAIGTEALFFNSLFPTSPPLVGTYNIAIGDRAAAGLGYAVRVVAIGYQSARNMFDKALTDAYPVEYQLSTNALSAPIAIGPESMQFNIKPSLGTAIGNQALQYGHISTSNTAIGPAAISDIRHYYENDIRVFSSSFQSSSAGLIGEVPFSNINSLNIGHWQHPNDLSSLQWSVRAGTAVAPTSFTVLSSHITGSRVRLNQGYQFGGNPPSGNSIIFTIKVPNAKNLSNNNTAIGPSAMAYFPGGPLIAPNRDTGYPTTITNNSTTLVPGTGDGSNVAIGPFALQGINRTLTATPGAFKTGSAGQYNVAIGAQVMSNIYKGTANTAIGYLALRGSETDPLRVAQNTVIGGLALTNMRIGISNVAIGYNAAGAALTGSTNVYIGTDAASRLQTGFDNTIIGAESALRTVSGSRNTTIGYQSLYNAGSGSFNNIAIGYQAGFWNSGSVTGNVYIGPFAGPTGSVTENNKLYISNASGSLPLIAGDFANKTVTISGSLLMSGSIIPNVESNTTTSSFSLGSPTAAWKGLYVSSGSIHFVDTTGTELAKISADPSGQIIVPNIYTDGTFTAQTFVTQSTTTIVQVYHATGSNIFGSSSLDTHQFTGSIYVSGAMYVTNVQQALGSNILTYNPSDGRLYYTSSTSLIGPAGPAGANGSNGASAYDIWAALPENAGGSISDFLDSLSGAQGLQGPVGPAGIQGDPGPAGAGFSGNYSGYSNTAVGNTQVLGTFQVTETINSIGSITAPSLQLSDQTATASFYVTQSIVPAGMNVMYSMVTASYNGLFVDYIAKKDSNIRAGQFITTWINDNIVFNETSTTDIGNTAEILLSSELYNGSVKLVSSVASEGWLIKTIIRSI